MTSEKPKIDLAQKVALEAAAIDRANKEPLPGTLAEAFEPNGDIIVGDFRVRTIRASDYPVLKKLNSSLYRQMVDGEKFEPQIEEVCEMCLQFTREPKEVRALLSRGTEAFREEALSVFGDRDLNDETLVNVFAAVLKQFQLSMSTMQTHGPKEEGKAGETFFRDSAVSQRTDLVGG